jgi:hypothetical protein
MSRQSLFIHSLYCFVFGASIGLGSHYIEYGWNPQAGTWAKWLFGIMTLLFGVAAVCGIFAYSRPKE